MRQPARLSWIAACLVVFVAAARGAPGPQAPDDSRVAAVLRSAGAYVAGYERAIAAVVAQEDYQQVVRGALGVAVTPNGSRFAATGPVARTTRADLLVLDLGEPGWVAFRDVYEVDGRDVRDHDERLANLFADFKPDSIEQARRIAAESARFNLNAGSFVVNRTINTPMTALLFLRGSNQARSDFRLDGTERVAGVPCVVLRFTERATPRLIGTRDGSPARGTFWIDEATGRILRTELELRLVIDREGQFLNAKLRVEFADVERLGLWLPSVMDETYDVRPGSQVIMGHAEYSEFRRFDVTTDTDVE